MKKEGEEKIREDLKEESKDTETNTAEGSEEAQNLNGTDNNNGENKISKQNDSEKTRENLQNNNTPEADVADRASTETERALELRTRDRQRKLLAKINAALARIKDGSYGYCIETGEPIGLKRLDARPIALLSIQAQERHEKHERSHRDDSL